MIFWVNSGMYCSPSPPQLRQAALDEQDSLWPRRDLSFVGKLKPLCKRSEAELHLSSREQLYENRKRVGTRMPEPFCILTDALIQRHSSGPEFRMIRKESAVS